LEDLIGKGMKKLVLDLQGNPGGYMDRAVDVADEMIGKNEMIVSQKGKTARFNAEYRAVRKGLFETEPVIVLIDENSASGSEIVAGALQDDDRALLVGRRSFGKGLVQVPMNLSDGSELRLTIARYYTPSGRSIQKPYNGNISDYAHEYNRRFSDGELFNADSIHFNDSLVYKTLMGRKVYGGGGIMPDIFVPLDTSFNTPYFARLIYQSIVREYTLDYFDSHKDELSRLNLQDFHAKFDVTDKMLGDLIALGIKEHISYNDREFNISKPEIKNQIKSLIARSVWDNDGYYLIANDRNEIYQEALRHFAQAEELAIAQTDKGRN
jgi:carboxyl-terminal processing protease